MRPSVKLSTSVHVQPPAWRNENAREEGPASKANIQAVANETTGIHHEPFGFTFHPPIDRPNGFYKVNTRIVLTICIGTSIFDGHGAQGTGPPWREKENGCSRPRARRPFLQASLCPFMARRRLERHDDRACGPRASWQGCFWGRQVISGAMGVRRRASPSC